MTFNVSVLGVISFIGSCGPQNERNDPVAEVFSVEGVGDSIKYYHLFSFCSPDGASETVGELRNSISICRCIFFLFLHFAV